MAGGGASARMAASAEFKRLQTAAAGRRLSRPPRAAQHGVTAHSRGETIVMMSLMAAHVDIRE